MTPILAILSLAALYGTTSAQLAPALIASQSSQYFIQNHNALVAPYVAPYVALAAPYVVAPQLSSAVLAPAAVAPQPTQPIAGNPGVRPSPNPDAETVEVESARVRLLQSPVGRTNNKLVKGQMNAIKSDSQRQTAAPGILSAQRLLQGQFFI